jgi:hypothetical protein
MRLAFVTEAASWILNKLRYAGKQSVSFLPSTEPGLCLSDAGASHISRSEIITFGRVSNLSPILVSYIVNEDIKTASRGILKSE